MKIQPTKEETLKAIQNGVYQAFYQWLDQLYVADVFKCIEDGVKTGVIESFPGSKGIADAIQEGVKMAMQNNTTAEAYILE